MCQDGYNTGTNYNVPTTCQDCFNNCENTYPDGSEHNGKKQRWCKISCNRRFNPNNNDGVCPQKITTSL